MSKIQKTVANVLGLYDARTLDDNNDQYWHITQAICRLKSLLGDVDITREQAALLILTAESMIYKKPV